MEKLKRFIPFILILSMLNLCVYAEDNDIVIDNTTDNEDIIETDNVLPNDIDNSDLLVKVVKQQGDTQTTIYTGPLGGYDNGA